MTEKHHFGIQALLSSVYYIYVFKGIEVTNKSYLLAVDVSESMRFGGVLGCTYITPLVASSAMALVLARREPAYQIAALSNCIHPVDVSSLDFLADVCRKLDKVSTERMKATIFVI